jgi:hypothetical protein
MKIKELLEQKQTPNEDIGKIASTVAGKVSDVAKPVIDKASDFAKPVIDKVSDFAKPVVDKVKDVARPYVDKLSTTVKDVLPKDVGDKVVHYAGDGHDHPPNMKFASDKYRERMANLDPSFKDSLYRAAKDSGLPMQVTSSHRSQEEQNDLYRRWQRGEPGIFMPSKNVGSHGGFAVDMNAKDVANLHRWLQKNDPDGTKYGLQTGIEFGDPVHVQLRNFNKRV